MNVLLISFQVGSGKNDHLKRASANRQEFGRILRGQGRGLGGVKFVKLLIVDDELRMANLLRRGLSEEGHSVTCAYNGADGLDLARQFEFDVILLDVMLPKMT
jgi:PleD family two-component response regulator